MLTPKIVFQDDDILVINKPSGLVVNRAETVKEKTLQDWTEKKLKVKSAKLEVNSDFINRSGIVHRLDKDTSGVMVIAKNAQSFIDLQKQFKQRKVIKKYLTLVHGQVEPKIGDIKLPLARNPSDRKKFSVRLEGRKSLTKYKVIKIISDLSFLEIEPRTGRTHQIRVHLKHIGYPLVSDPIYLGKKRLAEDRQWCSRLFLHAFYLSFIHPRTKKRVEFKIKSAKDLAVAIRNRELFKQRV